MTNPIRTLMVANRGEESAIAMAAPGVRFRPL